MEKVESKDEYSNFTNIYGSELKLFIYGLPTCLQVTILNCKKSLYKKCIFLFITAIFNSILLLFNIVTINVILGVILFMLIFLYNVCATIVEERIVLVKNLGIEITTRKVIGTKRVFYPHEQVQRIFINEIIFRGKVLFMLTLLIKEAKRDKLVPQFIDTLPQLALLKVVYSQMKKYL